MVRELLSGVRDGRFTLEEAELRLAVLPVQSLGHSRVDTHRALRCGFSEVVFGAGKSPSELLQILEAIIAQHGRALATRVDDAQSRMILAAHPAARFRERSRTITMGEPPEGGGEGFVLVLSAGTADGPVAEEAEVTSRMLGARVVRISDIGVAGLHRLLDHVEQLRKARVLVVVAGMEGALPSVVGGLVERPVIAVPTSVGYGASFGGLAALLAMLNSCAANVTVVNIDNGFGAGYAAALINRLEGVTTT